MKLLSLALLLTVLLQVHGQTIERHTISGYVKEAVSGESLIGVNIYLPDRKTGTVTNTYGFYSITLPAADSVKLIISYVGFTHEIVQTTLNRDIELNIDLNPNTLLKEVTVTANRQERQSESVKMSTVNLQVAQIKNVPSLLGEKDVLKVLQLMPGVQKGSEGSSGIYVRGGGPDQNLIILDDAIVYNASHLFGFFSLFNGDALKSVELTKGGFPARYGGRLSSVLEMNMKEGNKEEWHGEGGIGLISSRATVEGPLIKGRSSILLSGRRTYADLLLRPVLAAMEEENTGYYFYDFNAKINYDFGRKNKLCLSGYFGKDKFYLKNNTEYVKENVGFLWGNATGTLRWNHLFNNKVFANASAIFSNYTFGIYDKYKVLPDEKNYYAEYYSGIRDLSLKYDIDFIPNPKHWIKAGAITIFHRFKPHAFVELDVPNNIDIKDIVYTDGIESGIYIEDTWAPVQTLKINGGLRFSHFLASKNQYKFLEPRISAAWRLKNDFALKASYSSMNQYIHMLSGTGISLPTDLWVPTTDRVRPQQSQQVAIGIVKDIKKPELAFSLEGYFKNMDHVIGYKEGASFINLDDANSAIGINWEDNVTSGRAWSYGLEFLLQKKEGRFNGWIGYTLSWTQMQFDSLNFGKKYYARYDRRHDISIVGTYKLNDHITLSGTWVFGTGNAVTLPLSEYNAPSHQINGQNPHDPYLINDNGVPFFGQMVNDYGEKNNFRMKAYNRLDVGIQFHKEKKWGERTWEISVYNLYNRKNPFYYYTQYKFDKDTGKEYGLLKQVSLFPIIPSFTYSFKF
ncbi:MAG TPA: carboxypeptidase-like regulatory domain-containing protein [Bacteroidales bacterium]|nr:carboxypeptidase-like regulatory domain-containing protein [Bacteroidales bacterium]